MALKLLRIIARGVCNQPTILPILVFLGRFVLDLSANTCQTRHVTSRPLTLEVMALVGDTGLRTPSMYKV